jgi:hypothetical protein
MSFGSSTWDFPTEFQGSIDKPKVRDFWIPAQGTKRVMFLDSAPFVFYQHNLYPITKTMDKEVCLAKSGLGACPICEYNKDAENKSYPSFIGYFTVIDCGDLKYNGGQEVLEGWVSDKGINYQFGTKILGAKKGSVKKPGTLMKLKRLESKHGDLKFSVWDIHRSGKMVASVGDEWEYVTKFETQEEATNYLMNLGAEQDRLEFNSVNFTEHFTPSTYEELQNIVNPPKDDWGQAGGNWDNDDKGWG